MRQYTPRQEKLEAEIIKILEKVIQDKVGPIDREKSIRDQVNMDSMDFLDLVMELRKNHRVEVPEADYGNLKTMDSCIDYLEGKMPEKFWG